MKILKQPNEKVIAFIKTNSPETDKLRLASWTVSCSENGVHLMRNMFSDEVVRLTDEEFADPLAVPELVKRRFVVPDDYNETEKYLETVKLIKIMQPEKKGLKTYTILPTTGCNARCTYCFEAGYKVVTMTMEIADCLVDYICNTRHDDTVKLRWFGGEPLLGKKIISHVCSQLKNRGVPFKSELITNASLITKELVTEMKQLWNLEKVQVSLDGVKKDYMQRKQYLDPSVHNYDVVMQAIHYLADENIKVQLRVNFDKENLVNMQSFIDDMQAQFGNNENVHMYMYMLFQQQHQADCMEIYSQMFDLYRSNSDLKMLKQFAVGDKFKLNNCMADSLDKSVVISPDGKLHRCEHLPGNDKSWGNIRDGVTDQALLDQMMQPAQVNEKCRSCAYLPICTPLYKSYCPGCFDNCAQFQQMKTTYYLKKLIQAENSAE